MRYSYLAVALAAGFASAAPADEACAALTKQLAEKVVLKGGSALSTTAKSYNAEVDDYWNGGCRDLKPACFVFVQNAKDVSAALNVLRPLTDVKFVIKSGGHDPNVGHSCIDGGVVISLNKIKGATYDPKTGTAKVLPGGAWRDPIGDLQKVNKTMVSGRLDIVGVAGLLSGGGMSFLSAQHGLAADSIVEFELVFPNGTIANINRETNPVLLRALRGSNNAYGVITTFTVKAYDLGQVWGGQKIYFGSHLEALLKAIHDFTENAQEPKAAVIFTVNNVPGSNVVLVFFFYQGVTPPKGTFRQFEGIPSIYDTTKTTDYLSLLAANSNGAENLPTRSYFRTLTMPNIPNDNGQFWQDLSKIWIESNKNLASTVIPTMAMQPMPNTIGAASEKAGGNAMGLKGTDGNRMLFELTYTYLQASSDAPITAAAINMTNTMEAALKARVAKGILPPPSPVVEAKQTGFLAKLFGRQIEAGPQNSPADKVLETYNPLFINDATEGQEVFKSYREYETFAKLQKEVDPEGFFSKRSGGFKY